VGFAWQPNGICYGRNLFKVLNSEFTHNLEHDAKPIYNCPAGQQKLNNGILKHLNWEERYFAVR
jgi:hypothetical protein